MAVAEGLAERARTLGALWRTVTSRPLHPVGCTCMGHFMIPALDPRDMEADILDYMRSRYAAEGMRPLVELLDRREAERGAAERGAGERGAGDGLPVRPFRAWLAALPGSGLPDGALERFLVDMTATLESFAPAGGGGLICT